MILFIQATKLRFRGFAILYTIGAMYILCRLKKMPDCPCNYSGLML